MWMSYTLYSRVLDAEETITLLMPHPHQVTDKQYTIEDLYKKRRKLPVLFAMGDEGTENNWWMRMSFAEGDAHKNIAAVVCLRGMPVNEKTLRFIGEELPTLLCAMFPFDNQNMAFLGWKQSNAFTEKLADGPYRLMLKGNDEDTVNAMQAALQTLTEKE
jgi:hypothetical protein